MEGYEVISKASPISSDLSIDFLNTFHLSPQDGLKRLYFEVYESIINQYSKLNLAILSNYTKYRQASTTGIYLFSIQDNTGYTCRGGKVCICLDFEEPTDEDLGEYLTAFENEVLGISSVGVFYEPIDNHFGAIIQTV